MLAKHIQVAALLAAVQGSALCCPPVAQDADVRAPRLVSLEEGEAIAQVALQHWPQVHDKPDCSHLVHDVYVKAGLDYDYAVTDDIFEGIEGFQRVRRPQPGDLVVWQGHVGIVIDPEDTSFYSSVISGISVSSFTSSYWESRGPRRFYRYKITGPQSARLLSRVTYPKLRPPGSVVKPVYKASSVLDRSAQDDDAPDTEPDIPTPGAGPSVWAPVRIAGPTVSLARTPSREETGSAFTKLSDAKALELQQRTVLDSSIEIIDRFEVGKIETQGSFGWAEFKVRKIAVFADGKVTSLSRIERVRFPLRLQADGWTLQNPPNASYLLRAAAVRMITARLAELARNPDNAKDLKPLTRALEILLAGNRS